MAMSGGRGTYANVGIHMMQKLICASPVYELVYELCLCWVSQIFYVGVYAIDVNTR